MAKHLFDKQTVEESQMGNWHTDQPIIRELREVLPAAFPVLREPGHGLHRTGIGGYNRRTTRDGAPSAHAEGRAADIFLSVNIDMERWIGDALFDMFISHAMELGVDHIIWNGKIWSRTRGGPRLYTGSGGPHKNHVHVAFTRAGSQIRPPGLRTYVEEAKQYVLGRMRTHIAVGEP